MCVVSHDHCALVESKHNSACVAHDVFLSRLRTILFFKLSPVFFALSCKKEAERAKSLVLIKLVGVEHFSLAPCAGGPVHVQQGSQVQVPTGAREVMYTSKAG